jgi:hypothetical protein
MRHTFAVFVSLGATILTLESTAHASWSWASSSIGSIGLSGTGPTTIASPGSQPTLGHGLGAISPWYNSSGLLNFYVLDNTHCTGIRGCVNTADFKAWLYWGNQWYQEGNQTPGPDGYFWGLNATSDASYEYGWTSSSDSTPGQIFSGAIAAPGWVSPAGWNTTYTSVAMVTGTPGTSANGFFVNGGTIYYIADPGTIGVWDPNSAAGIGASSFAAQQVAIDTYEWNAGTTQTPISLNSAGVVQYYAEEWTKMPPFTQYWGQFSYTTVAANPSTGSCTTGTGTFYAVEIAAKNGKVFAIGGTDGAFSGPGAVYYLPAGGCWQTVGAAGSGPGTSAVSLATDNSDYAHNGTVGLYSVWVTDNNNKLYVACAAASCAFPF